MFFHFYGASLNIGACTKCSFSFRFMLKTISSIALFVATTFLISPITCLSNAPLPTVNRVNVSTVDVTSPFGFL